MGKGGKEAAEATVEESVEELLAVAAETEPNKVEETGGCGCDIIPGAAGAGVGPGVVTVDADAAGG